MFIDAIKDKDTIRVVERVDGERVFKDYPADYTFYYSDKTGKHKSIFGTNVTQIIPTSKKDHGREIKVHSGKKLFESDINPVFKCLADNYLGQESPTLNVAYFDIEADFDGDIGFSDPKDPYAAVTAISTYCTWLDDMITLALPPKNMSFGVAEEIAKQFPNTYVFKTEAEMLDTFLDIIDDADVLSGWNSEGYDIPYLVNRITRVLSKSDIRRFCLWGKNPKKREYEKFGAQQETFDLVGRVHLDYLNLYQKYTYHEMHSYSLDAIAEYELNERKIQYEGTLDQLYNDDFPKFIEYNRQDTMILKKLNDKLEFIELANDLAHANTVLMPTTLGTVTMTECAINNFAHELGMVVPDKKRKDDTISTQAAGAYVAIPKKGLWDWFGAIDIKSLYPSGIRACNMSPETIVGQIRPVMTDLHIKNFMAQGKTYTFAKAWDGLFGSLEYTAVMEKKPGVEVTIDWEQGTSDVLTASEAHALIFDNDMPWVLTANGTIFNTEVKGIIPNILERWYSERQELQAKMDACEDGSPEQAFWDKRQLVKKINLNSLYGALLNAYCRYYDKRLGQSTTLTGRGIARHMGAFANELITTEYDHTGDAIIYGDTDSIYFSAYNTLKPHIDSGEVEWNKESCLEMYQNVSDSINNSFPTFMKEAFNCPEELGSIISGGLELVAIKGLFVKKKKYAVLQYWNEKSGRLDQGDSPGKLKAMGLDLKRSDTPEFMQEFLKEILMDTLTGMSEKEVVARVKSFRDEFGAMESWEKGSPKRVNNLTKYTNIYHTKKGQKGTMIPGHVSAAIAWNTMRRMNSDNYSMQIMDGQKTIVCKLKHHPLDFKAISYPIDEHQLPQWFKELPFDDVLMEETIIDKKIDNLLGVLKWDMGQSASQRNTYDDFFSYDD